MPMMHSLNSNEPTDERRGGRYRSGKFWMRRSLPMHNNRGVSAKLDSGDAGSFITLDEVIELANELVAKLNQLGERTHPLAIRRAHSAEGEEVDAMSYSESETVKAGGKTYFFDIKQSPDGRRYLVITESRFKGEGSERERVSLVLFPEHAQAFLDKLQVMTAKL